MHISKNIRPAISAVLTASSVAIFSALVAGCGGSHAVSTNPGTPGNPGSSTPSSFSVSSSAPVNGATGVALTATIQVTFSSAVNSSTVNTSDIAVSDPSGAVSGSVSYNATSNTATFTPAAALAAGTTYSVKVVGVTSSTGTALASADTFTFTTAGSPSATLQYLAPLFANGSSDTGGGQVTVDTSGNVAVQLSGATSAVNETLTVLFCPSRVSYNQGDNCLTVGTINTNAGGNGSTTTAFPQTGPWAGDFELFPGTNPNVNTTIPSYQTYYGTNYMSTLQPDSTVNAGEFSSIDSGYQQGPLTSGTITYSASPAPYGTLTFTLAGAPANTTFEAAESINGLQSYELEATQGSQVETNSQGDLTMTVTPGGDGGDIFSISPQAPAQGQATYLGYIGGFSVPQ
jgi:hypothetical protein